MASLKNTTVAGTGAIQLPVGTTAQRPVSPVSGDMRFNTDISKVEYYNGIRWIPIPETSEPIVTDSLKLHLDAGRITSYPGSGTSWFDVSGNSNNLSLINGPTFDSANGGSIDFDGVNDYATKTTPVTTATTNVTLESVAFLSSTSQRGPFLYNGSGGGYGIGVGGTTYDNTGNNIIVLFQNIRWINTGVSYGGFGWKHVVLTLDGSGIPTVYLNGSLVGTYSGTVPNTPIDTTNVAVDVSGGSRSFGGRVAIARIYDKFFTSADVTQNFEVTRVRYGL